MKLKLYVDATPRSIGYVIEGLGAPIVHAETLGDGFTTNTAEYFALISGVKRVRHLSMGQSLLVNIYSDSELLVHQLGKRYRIKNKGLIPFYISARYELGKLPSYTLSHIRGKDNPADAVSRGILKCKD